MDKIPIHVLLEKGLEVFSRVTENQQYSKQDWIDLYNFESAVKLVIQNEKSLSEAAASPPEEGAAN